MQKDVRCCVSKTTCCSISFENPELNIFTTPPADAAHCLHSPSPRLLIINLPPQILQDTLSVVEMSLQSLNLFPNRLNLVPNSTKPLDRATLIIVQILQYIPLVIKQELQLALNEGRLTILAPAMPSVLRLLLDVGNLLLELAQLFLQPDFLPVFCCATAEICAFCLLAHRSLRHGRRHPDV